MVEEFFEFAEFEFCTVFDPFLFHEVVVFLSSASAESCYTNRAKDGPRLG